MKENIMIKILTGTFKLVLCGLAVYMGLIVILLALILAILQEVYKKLKHIVINFIELIHEL